MGLMSKEEAEREYSGLSAAGISTEIKKEVSFDLMELKENLSSKDSYLDEKPVLEISTYGIKDGEVLHNMPCPVCLKNRAIYMNDGSDSFFSPCSSCAKEGYSIKKCRKRRKMFFKCL